MEQISIERLSLCHPLLQQKIRAMDAVLLSESTVIRIVQGVRTFEEQNELFAKRPKVTNAPGGYSMHNFGLAVDCIPGIPNVTPWEPDWDTKHIQYPKMVAAGEAQGLVSGSNWHSLVDWPHFQLGGLPVTPTEQMRQDFYAGGLPLVWQKFDGGVYA